MRGMKLCISHQKIMAAFEKTGILDICQNAPSFGVFCLFDDSNRISCGVAFENVTGLFGRNFGNVWALCLYRIGLFGVIFCLCSIWSGVGGIFDGEVC